MCSRQTQMKDVGKFAHINRGRHPKPRQLWNTHVLDTIRCAMLSMLGDLSTQNNVQVRAALRVVDLKAGLNSLSTASVSAQQPESALACSLTGIRLSTTSHKDGRKPASLSLSRKHLPDHTTMTNGTSHRGGRKEMQFPPTEAGTTI